MDKKGGIRINGHPFNRIALAVRTLEIDPTDVAAWAVLGQNFHVGSRIQKLEEPSKLILR